MRRITWMLTACLLTIGVAIVLAGCGAAPTQEPPAEEPAEETEPTDTPTEEPTAPPEPTATPLPTEAPTDVPAEEDDTEAEAEPTEEPATSDGDPTVLIVYEDNYSGRPEWTSGDEIGEVLDDLGIAYDTLSTLDGFPGQRTLGRYDVVFWAVGDDCCDSPPTPSTTAMQEYLDEGGNLFVEGASVAFPWANNEFLEDYLGVQWDGFGGLADVVVDNFDHPLAQGFADETIELNVNGRIEPDVVTPGRDEAEVIFVRGIASAQRDAAAIVAYEDDGNKVVFSTVPLQWFPDDSLELLINNAMAWFSE